MSLLAGIPHSRFEDTSETHRTILQFLSLSVHPNYGSVVIVVSIPVFDQDLAGEDILDLASLPVEHSAGIHADTHCVSRPRAVQE